ncbi:MAG: type II toxin-antitoxin system VapC family toxin [Deltaproteobacteria bacterium]|jgi:predicted nucleic acid-binding protein|nr:type II toxin-antitoxin system VapC family toxin [Deltaproteobacteria bacterium]
MDTNIAIDYLNGLSVLTVLSERLRGAELYASVVTRMEFLSYHRLTAEDEPCVQALLAGLNVIPIDPEIERATIALRRAVRLKLPDSIIAATARVADATLVTRDHRLAELNWPGLRTLTF